MDQNEIKEHNRKYMLRELSKYARRVFPRCSTTDLRIVPSIILGDLEVSEICHIEHPLKGVRSPSTPQLQSAKLREIKAALHRWVKTIQDSRYKVHTPWEVFRQNGWMTKTMAFPEFPPALVTKYPDYFRGMTRSASTDLCILYINQVV